GMAVHAGVEENGAPLMPDEERRHLDLVPHTGRVVRKKNGPGELETPAAHRVDLHHDLSPAMRPEERRDGTQGYGSTFSCSAGCGMCGQSTFTHRTVRR